MQRFFKYIKVEKDKENLKNNYRLKETKDKGKVYMCYPQLIYICIPVKKMYIDNLCTLILYLWHLFSYDNGFNFQYIAIKIYMDFPFFKSK